MNIFKSFASFVMMFVGAGFISGSIVHFGEGVTTWDVGVLSVGVILFIMGSLMQELDKGKHFSKYAMLGFVGISLILSIGIGMASGGFQHYIDTPSYSSWLIPLGLFIGFLAYGIREGVKMRIGNGFLIVCASAIVCLLLWRGLIFLDTQLPDSIREGHGSHGHHAPVEKTEVLVDDHGHDDVGQDDHHDDDPHGH